MQFIAKYIAGEPMRHRHLAAMWEILLKRPIAKRCSYLTLFMTFIPSLQSEFRFGKRKSWLKSEDDHERCGAVKFATCSVMASCRISSQSPNPARQACIAGPGFATPLQVLKWTERAHHHLSCPKPAHVMVRTSARPCMNVSRLVISFIRTRKH